MIIAYFDCFSGISGDMVLGAFIDLGLPLDHLIEELQRLQVGPFHLKAEKERRHSLTGTNLHVEIDKEKDISKSFREIGEILESSSLKREVKDLSLKIFRRLAEAEGKIHQREWSDVHFHEIGSTDSIIDIVGTAIGVDFFGFQRFYSSKVPLTRGSVKTCHGVIPLPAPVTLELLKGVPVYYLDRDMEIVTPTGAAILTTLAHEFGDMPEMFIGETGYGAGDKNPAEYPPNLLRIITGLEIETDKVRHDGPVLVIEANIDDMSPELCGYLMERLLEEGALDVFFSSIYMKKNRPGVLLSVICNDETKDRLVSTIFKESTTLGVRVTKAERVTLSREIREIDTKFGKIRVKWSRDLEGKESLAPEYEECRRIAKEKGIPLKEVFQEVAKRNLEILS